MRRFGRRRRGPASGEGKAAPIDAYNFRKHYAPFLEMEVPCSRRALELGCGTGVYTRFMCDRGSDLRSRGSS